MAEPEIGKEMEKIPYEPLLPVEMTLIKWSLIIGAASLVILVWISYTFFPAGG